MALILMVLLPTALLLGWWGIEDLSEALTYAGRITGAILILVSVLSLLGSVAVVDHWGRNVFPYSGMVALIGTVAALLTNTMLLLETFRDGDSTLYRVLFILLTAGSAGAVLTVWRTSVVIPSPKRVAAAVVVSSALAVANFGYQHLYQPSQHSVRPLVNVTVGEPVLSKDRKKFVIPVDIKIENRSDVGFYVLGTEFHAMGEQVSLSRTDGPVRSGVRTPRRSVSSMCNARSPERRSTSPASWCRRSHGCLSGTGSRQMTRSSPKRLCNFLSTRRTTSWLSTPPRNWRARTDSVWIRSS
ncbi:hypothetical protein ACR6C2_06230 [Streptomyces sp. INA 01156]